MMNSGDDDYKNKLSDFARIIQEGKKHKLQEDKRLVEEKKQALAKKIHKKELSLDSSGFLDELFGAMTSKETTPLVVENPDYIPVPDIPEDNKPIVEVDEKTDDLVEEEPQVIEKTEIDEPSKPEESLITKTVKSITKVSENTNLFSTTPTSKVEPNFKAVQDKLKYLEQWVSKISSAGPGSGSYWLNDMGDTDKQSLYNATDGQVLTYNLTLRKWTAQDPQGGSGGGTLDQYARETSNNSLVLAQAAYDYANTIVSDTQVDPVARSRANSSYDKANNASLLAQSAFDYANTILSDTQIDPYARPKANGAYDKANVASTLAQAAYDYANTIVSDTQIDPWARNQANAAFLQANTPPAIANSASVYANAAFVQANTATTNAAAADGKATSAFLQANTATTNASSASSYANAAFTKANTAITTSGGQTITGNLTANAATAFIAGTAAESGVALQMPREGALRNMTNGSNNMYFDVSNGGTPHGAFLFRSSSSFTQVANMSTTAVTFNPDATVTSQSPAFGRTPFNSALDTVVTVDNLKYRISNQGGVFPQIASASGSAVDVCYDVLGVVNGNTPASAQNSGYILLANGTWLSIYSSHGIDARGDRLTAHITDKAASKIYRATFIKTNNSSNSDGYNIIVERII